MPLLVVSTDCWVKGKLKVGRFKQHGLLTVKLRTSPESTLPSTRTVSVFPAAAAAEPATPTGAGNAAVERRDLGTNQLHQIPVEVIFWDLGNEIQHEYNKRQTDGATDRSSSSNNSRQCGSKGGLLQLWK